MTAADIDNLRRPHQPGNALLVDGLTFGTQLGMNSSSERSSSIRHSRRGKHLQLADEPMMHRVHRDCGYKAYDHRRGRGGDKVRRQ
jgi:hypothetical protein